VRYRLPDMPDVFVDVINDEDVRLMVEEGEELRARVGETFLLQSRVLGQCIVWERVEGCDDESIRKIAKTYIFHEWKHISSIDIG
jgi:hypothetical protein